MNKLLCHCLAGALISNVFRMREREYFIYLHCGRAKSSHRILANEENATIFRLNDNRHTKVWKGRRANSIDGLDAAIYGLVRIRPMKKHTHTQNDISNLKLFLYCLSLPQRACFRSRPSPSSKNGCKVGKLNPYSVDKAFSRTTIIYIHIHFLITASCVPAIYTP